MYFCKEEEILKYIVVSSEKLEYPNDDNKLDIVIRKYKKHQGNET